MYAQTVSDRSRSCSGDPHAVGRPTIENREVHVSVKLASAFLRSSLALPLAAAGCESSDDDETLADSEADAGSKHQLDDTTDTKSDNKVDAAKQKSQ